MPIRHGWPRNWLPPVMGDSVRTIRPVTTPSPLRPMKLPIEESELIFCDVQDIRLLRVLHGYRDLQAEMLK